MISFSKYYPSVIVFASIAVAGVLFIKTMNPAQAAHEQHEKAHPVPQHLTHINTQAEAESLKPGDSLAMVCSHCKIVTVRQVGKDQSHVRMMTIGNKHNCHVCKGSVEVVGTGDGQEKHKQVKHVCSKCGDDAMFICATKTGHKHQHEDHD